MIPCNTSNHLSQRCVWGKRPAWERFSWLQVNPGKRFALPHSRILIHQHPWEDFKVRQRTIDIQAKEILRLKDELNGILAKLTNQTFEKIQADTERDYYMTSEQAKEYGIIDTIIVKRAK